MPRKYLANDAATKLSLSLTPDAASEIRRLAEKQAVPLAEVVRRSLTLYRFVDSLSEDEELCVRNRRTGESSRLVTVGL
jgi:hypothetical protein